MSCSMCFLKLLTKKELIIFLQKIGHFQAARIIEEYEVDGSKILELTEEDVSSWRLTEVEKDMLWKCVEHLKLNHLTPVDCQRLMKRNTPVRERWSISNLYNKYFKYKPNKNNELYDEQIKVYDEVYYAEYILGPEQGVKIQNQNNVVDGVKYAFINDDKYVLLDNYQQYLDLIAANNHELPRPNTSMSNKSVKNPPPSETKKKPKGFKWGINLFCINCTIRCVVE